MNAQAMEPFGAAMLACFAGRADADTLTEHAPAAGWQCQIVLRQQDGHYLARLTKGN